MDIQSVNIWLSAYYIRGIKMGALENNWCKIQCFLKVEAVNVMGEQVCKFTEDSGFVGSGTECFRNSNVIKCA